MGATRGLLNEDIKSTREYYQGGGADSVVISLGAQPPSKCIQHGRVQPTIIMRYIVPAALDTRLKVHHHRRLRRSPGVREMQGLSFIVSVFGS